MSRSRRTILAIDPAARGFGFAVLEEPDFLVDWGLRGTRATTQRDILRAVQTLLDEYQPELLVAEDPKTSRRGVRAKKLIHAIAQLAVKSGLPCRQIPGRHTRRQIGLAGARAGHEVVLMLVKRFPELAPILPPKRRVYDSEDARMRLFRAVLLAAACSPQLG